MFNNFKYLKLLKQYNIKMKSVVIIGKGPSVQRCTKKFIDSFDDVAICNHPVYKRYEHLISNHADYDLIHLYNFTYTFVLYF